MQQLLARQGVQVPYSSLHRFAVAQCGFRDERRVTVRVAPVAAGELAEVDFGRLGCVPDPETGRRRTLHALIVTVVHSRHQYVHVCHTQTLADLLAGLEDVWEFFGGVPRRVVLDYVARHIIELLCPVPLRGRRTRSRSRAWRHER